MSKFKIGDTVKVINNDLSYTAYMAWAIKYGLSKYVPDDWGSNSPGNGTVGKVIAFGPHEIDEDFLYGIETKDWKQYIVSVKGLEQVQSSLKSLLQNGVRVKCRNNRMYTVIDGHFVRQEQDSDILAHLTPINEWEDNLCNPSSYMHDIVEIYDKPDVLRYFEYSFETPLLWKREEKSAAQIELENLEQQAIDLAVRIKAIKEQL